MPSKNDYVSKQLMYWAAVTGTLHGGAVNITYAQQSGPAILTGLHVAAGIYPVTMHANFTVPIATAVNPALTRRMIVLTPVSPIGAPVADIGVAYDENASAVNTVVVNTTVAGALANTVNFLIEIYRIEIVP